MRGPGCPPQAGTGSGCVPRFIIVNATLRAPESSTARSIRVTSDVRGPVPSAQAARATHIAAAKLRVLYLISPPDTWSTTSRVTDSGRQLQGDANPSCSGRLTRTDDPSARNTDVGAALSERPNTRLCNAVVSPGTTASAPTHTRHGACSTRYSSVPPCRWRV